MNPFKVIGINKNYWVIVFPMTGFMIGHWLDKIEDERMTSFRDKSALYGRKVDKPSWP